MPSKEQESFGLAALKYMAWGLAIVSTNSRAQGEFITDSVNGFLIPPNNTDAMSETTDG